MAKIIGGAFAAEPEPKPTRTHDEWLSEIWEAKAQRPDLLASMPKEVLAEFSADAEVCGCIAVKPPAGYRCPNELGGLYCYCTQSPFCGRPDRKQGALQPYMKRIPQVMAGIRRRQGQIARTLAEAAAKVAKGFEDW